MLQRGDPVPHVEVRTVTGELFRYVAVWQRRNLVLVALPVTPSAADRGYILGLTARASAFAARDAECVITRDRVAGMASPGVLVADRWGQIAWIATPSRVEDLTPVDELLEWLDYLDQRCPECEGESR